MRLLCFLLGTDISASRIIFFKSEIGSCLHEQAYDYFAIHSIQILSNRDPFSDTTTSGILNHGLFIDISKFDDVPCSYDRMNTPGCART